MLSVEAPDSNPPSIDWVMSDDAFDEFWNERSILIQRILSDYEVKYFAFHEYLDNIKWQL